jgi:3-deoxy-manno-octulosonate cytidylyltransferase (CMP-KDO synthetase)
MPSGFVVVVPARYQSSRFPGKPLAIIAGKPLIEWVYRRAEAVPGASRVVVATDHDEIASAVRRFGGDVVMTSPACATGTDRVAEVARTLPFDLIVNVQGDEPLFPPELVGEMVGVAATDPVVDIVTACHPFNDEREAADPNVVKVVVDEAGRALYFSRAAIPYRRHAAPPAGRPRTGRPVPLGYRHVGIYVFRKGSLLRMSGLPRTRLEVSEGLEQLRALGHGMVIRVVETSQLTVGVDVPGDVKIVEKALGGG